nr:hypothetical protein [Pseudonocardia autotrophica]
MRWRIRAPPLRSDCSISADRSAHRPEDRGAASALTANPALGQQQVDGLRALGTRGFQLQLGAEGHRDLDRPEIDPGQRVRHRRVEFPRRRPARSGRPPLPGGGTDSGASPTPYSSSSYCSSSYCSSSYSSSAYGSSA